MNKVYRTIWNKAQCVFVAASELDHSQGKGKAGVTDYANDSQARNPHASARGANVPMRLIAVVVMGGLGVGIGSADIRAVYRR
ncbi:hypothetical protein J2785_007255 [Burkholderia ambifaria]|nr:hypothetical protein [Burkholderia ambifaria]